MRIVVIGANGYLGAWIAHRLHVRGHDVVRHVRSAPHEAENQIAGDIREIDTLMSIRGAVPDMIVHTVSLDHRLSEGIVSDVMSVNVHPLLELLQIYRGAKLPSLVYLSTVQVYGKTQGRVTENSQPSPSNVYGLTHLMCENIGHLFRNQLGTSVYNLRVGNAFGAPIRPNANCWSLAINQLCKMTQQTGMMRLESDGSPERDFLHVSDVADAVSLIASESAPPDGTYNVVSGESQSILSVAQLIARIQKAHGKSVSIIGPQGQDLSGIIADPLPTTTYSAESLRRLGWQCQVKLSVAIEGLLGHA